MTTPSLTSSPSPGLSCLSNLDLAMLTRGSGDSPVERALLVSWLFFVEIINFFPELLVFVPLHLGEVGFHPDGLLLVLPQNAGLIQQFVPLFLTSHFHTKSPWHIGNNFSHSVKLTSTIFPDFLRSSDGFENFGQLLLVVVNPFGRTVSDLSLDNRLN